MAWNLVQTASAEADAVGASIAASFVTANITVGNVILAVGSSAIPGADAAPDSMADTASNIYTPKTRILSAGSNYTLQHFYSVITAGGGSKPTVTLTFGHGSNQFRIIAVHEFSGNDNAAPSDVEAQVNDATGSAATDGEVCGPVTPTVDGELIFGSILNSTNGSAWITGTGFTEWQVVLRGVSFHLE